MPSTERVLGDLVHGLEPVRLIPRLRTVALGAALLGGIAAAAVIELRGLRADLLELRSPLRLIALGLLLAALGGIAASLGSAVPGRDRAARGGLVALIAGLVLSSGAAGWAILSTGAALSDGLGLGCLGTAVLAGVLPGAGLVAFLARAFPTSPAAALSAASGGAVALGGLSVHASCTVTGGLHLLVGHALGPFLGGAVLAVALYPFFRALRH